MTTEITIPKLEPIDTSGLSESMASLERIAREFAPEKKIVTVLVFPPIPVRKFDWCSYYDGEEEDGNYGWGPTRQEAIRELLKAKGKWDDE